MSIGLTAAPRPDRLGELAGLIEAGAADFVERKNNVFAEARGLVQRRLRQARADPAPEQNALDKLRRRFRRSAAA